MFLFLPHTASVTVLQRNIYGSFSQIFIEKYANNTFSCLLNICHLQESEKGAWSAKFVLFGTLKHKTVYISRPPHLTGKTYRYRQSRTIPRCFVETDISCFSSSFCPLSALSASCIQCSGSGTVTRCYFALRAVKCIGRIANKTFRRPLNDFFFTSPL